MNSGLHEEVDYLHEAENTEWFKSRLQLPGVIIPAVYKDYSSKRILTTERLRGLHLEAWLGTDPSQQARDHFGQRLYDIFVNSFYGLHALHADPNPGNYLFAKDGTLGLLDFGCVRYYSSDFVNLIPVLLHAYMERNAEKVISTYQQLGMVAEMSGDEQQSFYDQVLQPFGDWLTKPFQGGTIPISPISRPHTPPRVGLHSNSSAKFTRSTISPTSSSISTGPSSVSTKSSSRWAHV